MGVSVLRNVQGAHYISAPPPTREFSRNLTNFDELVLRAPKELEARTGLFEKLSTRTFDSHTLKIPQR